MENELENLDSPNEELETDDSTNVEEVDVEAIKKENAELKKTNQELYEREKKAKGFVRGTDGKWVKPEPKPVEEKTETSRKYSLEEIDDITALSSVFKDDRQEVLDYAERKGITPAKALEVPLIKTFLKEQEEFRKSAQTASIGGSKRGSSKTTNEELLRKANQGDIPDDDESVKKLVTTMRDSLVDKK